jgi:hypothetical protein
VQGFPVTVPVPKPLNVSVPADEGDVVAVHVVTAPSSTGFGEHVTVVVAVGVTASPMIPQTTVVEQAGEPAEIARLDWADVTMSRSARAFTWRPVLVVATKVNPVPAVPPVVASSHAAPPMMKSSALLVLRVQEGSPEVAVPVQAELTSGSNGCAVFAPETPNTTMLILAAAVAVTVTVPENGLVSVVYQVSRSHCRVELQYPVVVTGSVTLCRWVHVRDGVDATLETVGELPDVEEATTTVR